MRQVRQTEEEQGQELPAMVVPENEDKRKRIEYPYSVKLDFKRYTGNLDELPNPPADTKGKLLRQKLVDVAKRSQFFANQQGDKYKILMVYKGKGNNKRQQVFDVIGKKDKNKYLFFKQKGIIL